MFLVTHGTRTILHHVWFVKGVGPFVLFKVAGLAIFIDRIKSNAMLKSIPQDFLELNLRQLAAGQQ